MGYKFNPFTGTLDVVYTTRNFSQHIIPVGTTLTIPENQQMIVHTPMRIDGDINIRSKNGVVRINGKKIHMNKSEKQNP